MYGYCILKNNDVKYIIKLDFVIEYKKLSAKAAEKE